MVPRMCHVNEFSIVLGVIAIVIITILCTQLNSITTTYTNMYTLPLSQYYSYLYNYYLISIYHQVLLVEVPSNHVSYTNRTYVNKVDLAQP